MTTNSLSTASPTATAGRSGVGAVLLAILVNLVVSTLVAFLIGRVAIALGAPANTMQYQVPVLAVIILIASVIGAVGWTIVRRRAKNPAGLVRVLAPVVLVVSLVPDALLGLGGGVPWSAVGGLMVMHVVVAAITVATFSRLLPLPRRQA